MYIYIYITISKSQPLDTQARTTGPEGAGLGKGRRPAQGSTSPWAGLTRRARNARAGLNSAGPPPGPTGPRGGPGDTADQPKGPTVPWGGSEGSECTTGNAFSGVERCLCQREHHAAVVFISQKFGRTFSRFFLQWAHGRFIRSNGSQA